MPTELQAFMVDDGNTVIVSCGDSSPEQCWLDLERAAGEFGMASVVFVWRDRGKWAATKMIARKRLSPSQTDLEIAVEFLAKERILHPGDHIVFRCEVPDGAKPVVARTVKVPRRWRWTPWGRLTGTREQIMTDKGIKAWIEQENAETIDQIALSLRSPTGVIPFLGAGMSAVFKYPLWGDFFEDFANDAAGGTLAGPAKLPREKRDAVIALVKKQLFEKAANILVKWDEKAFYERLENDFGEEPDLVGKPTPLTRLPLIAPGPIITTNVDPVIETVYKRMGKPFPDNRRILGARTHPVEVVTALQQNLSALIKLHGDAKKADSLIFTEIEYQEGYGSTGNPGPIERLATVIYTNRPLLFLGCSLETDRTLKSLEAVYKRNPYVGHYAILATHFRSAHRDQRVKNLRNAAGIRPLWYRPGKHEDIDPLLAKLVSKTAADEITMSTTEQPTVPVVSPVTAPPTTAPSAVSTSTAIPPLAVSAVSSITAVTPMYKQPDLFSDLTQEHIDSVAKELAGGKLVFFLGAGVHQNRMHGNEFYEEICRQAGIQLPRRNRADAAQYVGDVDRSQLSTIVGSLVHANYTQPSQAHEFVASLPVTLMKLGQKPDILIMTTNYDAMTEAAFAAAQQPYHLFVYNHYGLYAGRFLHRRPDGREFAIRTPAAIHERLEVPAIVKLNGGIDPLGRLPETFVVATSDFEELSTTLPDVLPQVVWEALKKRSILFLGHGLGEPDVRSLMRRRKCESAPDSWAVQRVKEDTEFWQAVGIDLIEADLSTYLYRLEFALNASAASVP